MRHLAAFLFLVAACGGDGVGGGGVPLYGGGCETDGDCEAGAVCGSAGGLPGLCTTECGVDEDCEGLGFCLRPENICIELCVSEPGCDEGTMCIVSDEGSGKMACYPDLPR